ncbi:MAG: SH3 domain-containing protein, partial [Fusobacterium sp.]|nr:SH3 domain-containing protein [Fusobacterium sp.]
MKKIILLMMLVMSVVSYGDEVALKKDLGNTEQVKVKKEASNKTKSKKNNKKAKKSKPKFQVITEYKNIQKDNLKFNIGLEEFNRTFDNYIFMRKNGNIRQLPTTKSKIIGKAIMYQRLELLEAVQNNKKEVWYKVVLNNGKNGYIHSKLVSRRNYDYESAITSIEKLNKFVADNIEKIEEEVKEKEKSKEDVAGIIQETPEEIIINGVKQKVTAENIEEIKQKIIEETKKEILEKNKVKVKKSVKKPINKGIKVLKKYKPLDDSEDAKVDSKGNYANQSVTVFTDEARKKHYNLPDGTLMKIIGETSKYYIITSPYYEEKLYYPKKLRYYIKDTDIEDKIKKFIYVSERDQNEITFELDDENNYVVKMISNVTTGRKSKNGFKTPNGYFLVSIVRPYMKYVSHDNKKKNTDENADEKKEKKEKNKVEIVGEAEIAIRFTGGAYLHGLPYKLEPKETIEQRKKDVKRLLGTYPRSLKCIRNYDEVVKYQSEWIKYKSQDKYG